MITVYTANGCAYCKPMLDHLKSRGVKVQLIEVTESDDLIDELKKKTGHQSVPAACTDNPKASKKCVVGWEPEALDLLIEGDKQ